MRIPVSVVATGAALALAAAPAVADRSATKTERAAIKRVALAHCDAPGGCRFKKARVSTRSARYAWADIFGEGLSGLLVKRPTAHSRRFKVVGIQGGGIGTCSYWRARAPRSVLRDLHVVGLTDVSAGTTGSCG
jgi:curli biogenesis system outer membrane secretion channel CsgG